MLQIALDVAKGLVFLHSKRIVHVSTAAASWHLLCLDLCFGPLLMRSLSNWPLQFDLKSPNILLARSAPPSSNCASLRVPPFELCFSSVLV